MQMENLSTLIKILTLNFDSFLLVITLLSKGCKI